MMPMTIDELVRAVGGRLIETGQFTDAPKVGQTGQAQSQRVFSQVLSDSRDLCLDSLFVAIAGERVDGHDFVAGAGSAGALAALVDHPVPGADLPQIQVDDTVLALGRLAQYNLERRRRASGDFDIIGITGSVGKTTTKDLLAALLGHLGPTVAPVGSFNNEIGLPLTALRVGPDTRFLVAEMGANHVGEIANLTRIAPPDVSVVLKVGTAHVGEFGSVDRIAQAKSEIIQGLRPGGVAVLNAHDPRVAAMADLAPGQVLWFGMDGSDAAVGPGAGDGKGPIAQSMTKASDLEVDQYDRPVFTLSNPQGERAQVHLGISGRHNVMNALASATVAAHYGMPLEAITSCLTQVKGISPHRMDVSRVTVGRHGFTLIDDSFNANPDSMRAGLDAVRDWASELDHQPFRVAVLGAMLELGGDELGLHRQIGAYAAMTGINALIAVGSQQDTHLDTLAAALAQGAREALASESADTGGPGSGEDLEASRVRCRCSVHLLHGPEGVGALLDTMLEGHPAAVVLLKGSHASGLSGLAGEWGSQAKSLAGDQAGEASGKGE
ncbi:UDP-N-acetylmuramoyl-tripeptide--D-alanyl-D-alanine ligase [Bifidobacterium aemilianum]|uniref:UDP-N-acetylmuramoyl-tripeptide--D-alanyl-D-alanine ligase n=1 Tax=Bifidobacterium aemilianum TaxID=2493120 RepID=A0A366KBQ9_9BIFI|nr:UDP-N-acetylmuramoyl-tripeptide--D-alanyl-D-alanine ligase [Bifidobacterium aemilianum]RBP98682.1 UDP-N-acetylmuramoyl-tripeptide--D-alanyl-D-alanine ligase [Bifidobacterium aemilianum]